MNQPAATVRDCIESCDVVSIEASLFAVIDLVLRDECVLVKDKTNVVIGIVTAYDLSQQFRLLTAPFLLIGEIENHIRRLIGGRFTEADVAAAIDPNDKGRLIEDVSDLTFGECLRLIEDPARWAKLGLGVDRTVLVSYLHEVRLVRNDVMHFEPNGIGSNDLERLQRTVAFFQHLPPVTPR